MIRRLLVPLDGSKTAERALIVGGGLAESLSAALLLARVVPPPVPGRFYAPGLLDQLEAAQTREAETYLADTAARLRKDRLSVETRVLHGEIAPALVAAAERDRCDLIVITSQGMSGFGSRLFGSVAQRVLHTAPCPVLVVRATPDDLEGEEEREEQAADQALLAQARRAAARMRHLKSLRWARSRRLNLRSLSVSTLSTVRLLC